MKLLTILGSTGSIGKKTLSIIQKYSNDFSVYALVAKDNVSEMTRQCFLVQPRYACLIDENSADILRKNLKSANNKVKVLSGIKSACELASADSVDMVMSAIVGIAGIKPTFSAIRAGKCILLASKEIIVTCGELLIQEVYRYNASILPIDSEHNAIFQNLPKLCQNNLGRCFLSDFGIAYITLTASGGVFFNLSKEELFKVTPKQACNHPNWSMGPKISVDSATMMNKGLEYIEAKYLFNVTSDEIEILIHPQSVVHSMVHYCDGSVLAHLGEPDMEIPIVYAMNYPKRLKLKKKKKFSINSFLFQGLVFKSLNYEQFPCLKLAIEISNSRQFQSAAVVLNAANEIAVEEFLFHRISFLDISNIIYQVLDVVNLYDLKNIEDILNLDQEARQKTRLIAKRFLF